MKTMGCALEAGSRVTLRHLVEMHLPISVLDHVEAEIKRLAVETAHEYPDWADHVGFGRELERLEPMVLQGRMSSSKD